jgi:hypothetical protein
MSGGPGEQRARMPVTGYEPGRLRNDDEPNAAENRRVELRWIWPAVTGDNEANALDPGQ